MPRSPVANVAREVRVTIRATPDERDEINRLRGATSVSDYLRALVRQDASRRRTATSRKDADV